MRRLRIWLAMKLLPHDAEVANALLITGRPFYPRRGAIIRNCTFESLVDDAFLTIGDKG